MDAATRNLLNIGLSVLAPVIILNTCSSPGTGLLDWGPAPALVVALCLPLGYGVYSFATSRKVEALTLFGLLGTLLTGVVSLYANTGDGMAIRPDTPWWYAAKEALMPLLLGGAMLVSPRAEGSMMRTFLYSDSLFNVPDIEKAVAQAHAEELYERILRRAALFTACSFFVSAAANFALALFFMLPIHTLPAEQQAVAYNHAVGDMTWWGYVIIGLPLMVTIYAVMRYLIRHLSRFAPALLARS